MSITSLLCPKSLCLVYYVYILLMFSQGHSTSTLSYCEWLWTLQYYDFLTIWAKDYPSDRSHWLQHYVSLDRTTTYDLGDIFSVNSMKTASFVTFWYFNCVSGHFVLQVFGCCFLFLDWKCIPFKVRVSLIVYAW